MKEIPANLEIEHLIWQENIRFIAGLDEAGRGPLAGPVAAGAVIFTPYDYIEEVKDSILVVLEEFQKPINTRQLAKVIRRSPEETLNVCAILQEKDKLIKRDKKGWILNES